MRERVRDFVRPFARAIAAAGFDTRRILALKHYPEYFSQKLKFLKAGGKITHWHPVFVDYGDQAGSAKGHYFHQDLLVAARIFEKRPARHIDIGSRIDGFVAHVAAFRKIEVMDVRSLESSGHENISFLQANLMDGLNLEQNASDSISCLHAIEHFGLGRYGDPVDPDGHKKGFHNMLSMLKTGGTLYISFPIAHENQVHFNAHRCFHPSDILTWAHDPSSIRLVRFDYVDDAGDLHRNAAVEGVDARIRYGCGIYTFEKLN